MTEQEKQLKRIADLLECHLGDTDPVLPDDQDVLEDEFPVHAAMQLVVELMLAARTTAEQSNLTVWSGSMPESNGKSNFTAILHRGDLSKGFTIDRSEYPDRVRYEADRVRWLIGEIDKEPWILDYDADKHSGYVSPNDAPTEPSRDSVIEEWIEETCAAYCIPKPFAIIEAIRALKSQQDAAIESKQAESRDSVDAKRYRMVRQGKALTVRVPVKDKHVTYCIGVKPESGFPEAFDEAIDAAIESQRSGDGS